MLNSIFDGTTIPLLEKLAAFGERRQTVLSANVANIDTPNYKRRDLPVEAFQAALKDAVASRRSSESLGANGNRLVGQPSMQSGDVASYFPRELFQPANSPSPSLTFQDNNNRSVEHEMMQMTKNVLMQNFAIELMTAQMGMLQAAIRGQV
jgi:flagellar basal-body rod protein FlgB